MELMIFVVAVFFGGLGTITIALRRFLQRVAPRLQQGWRRLLLATNTTPRHEEHPGQSDSSTS